MEVLANLEPMTPPVRLSDISQFITKGATPTTYGFPWESSGTPFLRSECVSSTGLDLGQAKFISEAANQALRRSQVDDGDILMTITGNVGRVVRLSGLGPANINQHIARIRVRDERFDPGFVYHYLNQPQIRTFYESITTGQAYPQISLVQVRQTVISNVGLNEQRQISEALDDCDALITSIRYLIAKKQAVKQGMMQQLLTGKTRLPGFTGDWIDLDVAENSHLKARIGWQGLSVGEYRDVGEYGLIGGTNFANGRVDWSSTPFVDKWRFDQDSKIQVRNGDVLITKDGSIGKVAFVEDLPGPSTLNSGVFVLRPKNQAYDSGFLYFLFRSRAFDDFVSRLSAGSTISHLYQRDLAKLRFDVPPTLAEQKAISTALFDVDAELTLLQKRLESTRNIKRGMMQELLTGRTRLSPVGV